MFGLTLQQLLTLRFMKYQTLVFLSKKQSSSQPLVVEIIPDVSVLWRSVWNASVCWICDYTYSRRVIGEPVFVESVTITAYGNRSRVIGRRVKQIKHFWYYLQSISNRRICDYAYSDRCRVIGEQVIASDRCSLNLLTPTAYGNNCRVIYGYEY